jgi:hypothetical protein
LRVKIMTKIQKLTLVALLAISAGTPPAGASLTKTDGGTVENVSSVTETTPLVLGTPEDQPLGNRITPKPLTPRPPVPEPSTLFAGVLMLLPFGVGLVRVWRKRLTRHPA